MRGSGRVEDALPGVCPRRSCRRRWRHPRGGRYPFIASRERRALCVATWCPPLPRVRSRLHAWPACLLRRAHASRLFRSSWPPGATLDEPAERTVTFRGPTRVRSSQRRRHSVRQRHVDDAQPLIVGPFLGAAPGIAGSVDCLDPHRLLAGCHSVLAEASSHATEEPLKEPGSGPGLG